MCATTDIMLYESDLIKTKAPTPLNSLILILTRYLTVHPLLWILLEFLDTTRDDFMCKRRLLDLIYS